MKRILFNLHQKGLNQKLGYKISNIERPSQFKRIWVSSKKCIFCGLGLFSTLRRAMKKKLFLWLQSIIRTPKLYDITERGVAGFSFEFAEQPTRRLLYPSIRRLRLGVFYKDQGFKVGGRDRCRYMSIEPSRVSKKCNILLL